MASNLAPNDHPMCGNPNPGNDWEAGCDWCGHPMFLHDAEPFVCSLATCDCPPPRGSK